MKYTPTIGLEIHVELKTNSKMFCSCKNDPDEKEPNKNICPICLAHPGTLPTINEEAVRKVLKTGLALNCDISEYSHFDRKNYFYPDLPKGYQISQYKFPLCGKGYLDINLQLSTFNNQLHAYRQTDEARDSKRINITRIHLEEDTGSLIHPEKTDYSLVNFNRAGVPLMELVTEPDLASSIEAKKFCEELQLILRYLDVSNADMEKGQMRCEVNISLRKTDGHRLRQADLHRSKNADKRELGTKVEIKNLNSFKAVEKAIDYEIKRQSEILEDKGEIIHETRGWEENKQITVSQRSKEKAHDYRYFPEPDLPPIEISKIIPSDLEKIEKNNIYLCDIQKNMPELPQAKRERFAKEYRLPVEQIEIFVQNKDLGEYFEKVASELKEWVAIVEQKENLPKPESLKLYKLAANYLITELQKITKGSRSSIDIEKITPENFAELIKMIHRNEINSSAAQTILKIMYETGKDPSDIAQEQGLTQLSDATELESIIDKLIGLNQKVVADYKKGQENALQYLIGQVMKETKGKANPKIAQEILYKKLTS